MIISGLFSAGTAIYQGNQQAKAMKAQASAYDAQAQIAENNKAASLRQATESLNEGAREERRFRLQSAQFAGTQESALAASGATMGGSALNIMSDTAMGIEQDAMMLRYNTQKQKWGYDVQAVNFLNEADAARTSAHNARVSAKNAKTAGLIGAAGSLLGMGLNIWGASPVTMSTAGNSITLNSGGGSALGSSPMYTGNWYK
jgi:hypothetical protein